MKLLLVNPPYQIEKYYGRVAKLGFNFPPMAILCLAAYIRDKGHEVKAYDFQANEEDFFSLLNDFKPDVVGITCHTALVYSTIGLSKKIKQALKDCRIIVGGSHPSVRPQDLLSESSVDIVVRGEGELTLLEILECLEGKKNLPEILGITYRNEAGVLTANGDRPLIKDINTLPMPALDLLPHERYRASPDMRVGKKVMMLSTARGCPYRCTFCAMKESFSQTYRSRSVENIFKEIDFYVRNYSADGLFIVDELFTANKKRVLEFCNLMIEKGYSKSISWWAQTRADCIDEEMLGLMRQAGCRMLSFGIESGVDRLLTSIRKNVTIKQVKNAVKMVNKAGIDARGSFILGLPGETFSDSIRTIMFGLSLPLQRLKFGLATPFPGTELWDIAVREGKIKENEDWDRFSLMAGYTKHEAPYVPQGRTSKQLRTLQLIGNFLFFIKPGTVISIVRYYASFGDFKGLLFSFKEFLKATFLRK